LLYILSLKGATKATIERGTDLALDAPDRSTTQKIPQKRLHAKGELDLGQKKAPHTPKSVGRRTHPANYTSDFKSIGGEG
jgi:hypothetical protein